MSTLDNAYLIACRAHMGQKDDSGAPFINHPVAVCDMLQSEPLKMIALLHDVAERTQVSLQELEAQGFDCHVMAAVEALTRREEEKYEHYIKRVKQNPLATRVKICDLRHNSDLSRYPGTTLAQYKKIRKRLKYLIELMECSQPQ